MKKSILCRLAVCFITVFYLGGLAAFHPTSAAIYRWDNGELITDKNAVPYADLSHMNLGYAELAGTDLYHADLHESDSSFARLANGAFFETVAKKSGICYPARA